MILSVMLTTLKILCIIFACLILTVILVVSAMLLVPVRYRMNVEKLDKIDANINVCWFFKAVQFICVVNNSTDIKASIKIFGFDLGKKKEKPSAKNFDNATRQEPLHPPPETNSTESNDTEQKQPENQQEKELTGSLTEDSHTLNTKKQSSTIGKAKHLKKSKRSAKRKQKKSVRPKAGRINIKQIWEYKYRKEVLSQIIALIKRIVKALSHVRLEACLKVGTGEPHTTGYLMAVLYALSGCAGLSLTVNGDFENKSIKGCAEAKGKFIIGSFVLAVLLFISNKHVWRLVKKFIFRKDVPNDKSKFES